MMKKAWLFVVFMLLFAGIAAATDKNIISVMEQDGFVRKGNADWASARDASTGDLFQNTTDLHYIAIHLYSGDYRFYRTFLIFNLTDSIGRYNESMNITSVRLDTMSNGGGVDTIDDFFILEGTQGLWLLNDYSNYNDLNPAPSGSDGSGAGELSSGFCKQSYINTNGAWMNCTFNNTGRSYVQQSLEDDGLVTLALVAAGDYLDDVTSSTATYIGKIFSYEKAK